LGEEDSPPGPSRSIAAVAKRAIRSVDALFPVAVVIALGGAVDAILFHAHLLVAVTLAFGWAVLVLALVAWYNFAAARIEWPPLELWDRERRIWRQPWVPPAVLVIGAVIGIRFWS
jgi:hypothetical protein